MWVQPAEEANEKPGIAWLLKKTLPGLKGGPAPWGGYSTELLLERYGFTASRHEPCLYHRRAGDVWVLRHMDDFLFIGPASAVHELTEHMARTILLRDIVFLTQPGDKVQFLGRCLVKQDGGYDLSVDRGLAEKIVRDDACGLGRRACPVPGLKEVRRDVSPVSLAGHAYYRTQVGRLMFYVQYRPDMQYAVGQLSRKASAPEAWSMLALKRVIKYLSLSMDRVLQLRRSALDLYGHCDADWAGLEDRKSVLLER